MRDEKSIKPKSMNTGRAAMISAALAATGPSTPPLPIEPITYVVSLPPEEPNRNAIWPEGMLPPELSRYADLGKERLRVELKIGDETILVIGPDPTGTEFERYKQVVTHALEHPQRYDQLTLIISDDKGKLPVCPVVLPIPLEKRTPEHLAEMFAGIADQDHLLHPVVACSAQLSQPERGESDRWESAPIVREPADPNQIAHKEITGEDRLLVGRVDQKDVSPRQV